MIRVSLLLSEFRRLVFSRIISSHKFLMLLSLGGRSLLLEVDSILLFCLQVHMA